MLRVLKFAFPHASTPHAVFMYGENNMAAHNITRVQPGAIIIFGCALKIKIYIMELLY